MNSITVLGSDYEEGFADGKAGKPHGTWFGLFLRKGAYETGYNAGLQTREKAMREAAERDDDVLGFDSSDAKLYFNLLNETAQKAFNTYDKAKTGNTADIFKSPTPAASQTPPVTPPPSTPTSSTNFLTELHMGVPTYAWMLGGGAVVTGLVMLLKSRTRSAS